MRQRPLGRDTILDAAMALADQNGLDGLTMRALGAALGVEAPSLYKHVNGKEDILDGLTDRVYAMIEIGVHEEPWPDRVRRYATALRAGLLQHPALAPLIATRPVFTAASLSLVEGALDELTALGLADDAALYCVDTLVAFVTGHVLTELSAYEAGLDPNSLASARAMLPEEQYRLVRRTLGLNPVDRDREFAFGLDLIVAGMHQFIDVD